MKDGKGTWYDVRETPEDLASFPTIKDWEKAPKSLKKEYDEFVKILPIYDVHDTAHDAPGYVSKSKKR